MSDFEAAPARPPRPQPKSAWPSLLIGLAAPLLLVFALFWVRASLPDTNFGRGEDDATVRYWVKVIILCAGLATALWAALWYGFAAKRGRDIGATLFGVVFAATLAGAGGAVWAKQKANSAPREVAAMEAQWASTQERDIGSLVGELNAMRLSDVVDARSIRRDTDLSEASARLASARAALEKRRRWREQRIADYRGKIARLNADPATRQRVLAAFERQRRQTEVIVQEFLDGVEDTLVEAEALTKFLHRSRGAWRTQGDMIVFSSAADFERFDRGVENLRRAFDSQAAARWELRGNPLLAHDQELFPEIKAAPRHGFVLF